MGSFKVVGKFIVKGETEKKTETFSVREFVVEEPGERFNQFIKFQLSNDKCSLIDSFNIGDEVEVEFNLQGRKWEKDGKVDYFNTLSAWKIKVLSQGSHSNEPVKSTQNDDLPY